MTRSQPARWQKVPPGAAATNASQRAWSASVSGLTARPPALRSSALTSAVSGISGSAQENPVHPVPGEVPQQALKPTLHPVKVGVVAEARLGAGILLPRLARVDFP